MCGLVRCLIPAPHNVAVKSSILRRPVRSSAGERPRSSATAHLRQRGTREAFLMYIPIHNLMHTSNHISRHTSIQIPIHTSLVSTPLFTPLCTSLCTSLFTSQNTRIQARAAADSSATHKSYHERISEPLSGTVSAKSTRVHFTLATPKRRGGSSPDPLPIPLNNTDPHLIPLNALNSPHPSQHTQHTLTNPPALII